MFRPTTSLPLPSSPPPQAAPLPTAALSSSPLPCPSLSRWAVTAAAAVVVATGSAHYHYHYHRGGGHCHGLARRSLACGYSGLGSGLCGAGSPVQEVLVRGRKVFVKRDDMMRLPSSGVCGNKARKLYSLDSIPFADFPPILGSHGGSQSNAMLALAALAKAKNATFKYITRTVATSLKENPRGNLKAALDLGMELVEIPNEAYDRIFNQEISRTSFPPEVVGEVLDTTAESMIWVPQGGACYLAERGVELLAEEIYHWWADERTRASTGTSGRRLNLVLPSGTGTTSLYLARHLKKLQEEQGRRDVRVLTVPCVGDPQYLKEQLKVLDSVSGLLGCFPDVLHPDTLPKRSFANPARELIAIWTELKEAGLDVDLIYAPRTWEALFHHWESSDSLEPEPGTHVDSKSSDCKLNTWLYVHTGGLEGVESMLDRYRRAGYI